jgi:Uncharacterized conserved protein (DUF2278)
MALDHGYGVLRGTLSGHFRDPPDDFGRWYHVHLNLDVSGTDYEVAVDVDSKQSSTGVQWKVVNCRQSDVGPAAATSVGYHSLAPLSTSGALDHIRHPVTKFLRWGRSGCMVSWFPWFVLQPWKSGTHLDASVALESILVIGRTVLVWGEPFTTGNGMHNVHQNQGDPAGSQWWNQNGIWQDGGVAVFGPNGDMKLFVSKFTSQASKTDSSGHPA